MVRKKNKAEALADAMPPGGPARRPATPEEQAMIEAHMQRQRTELAVLKQRFAETDVAKTIAEAERDQLIQQMRRLQQENTTLREELEALKNPKKAKKGEEPKAEES